MSSEFQPSFRMTPAVRARQPFAAVAAVAALAALQGCMHQVDPAAARAEFSSKSRSIQHAGAADARHAARVDGEPAELNQPVLAQPTAAMTGGEEGAVARASAVPTESERASAETILRAAARSNWAALRANAIEASRQSPTLLKELAPAGLADENRGVRFVACMAIAEARSGALGKDLAVLVRPLLQDESASVRAAAMLALSRCGQTVDLTPLAAMLGDNEPEVRANAYLVLGELGNQSAAPLIRDSIGHGMKLVNPIRARLVDLTAAEALVKLGDEREIEPIRAALFAPPEQAELTLVACDAIGRLRDEVSRPMLERLLSVSGDARRSPEIRLAAARAVVKLGGAAPSGIAVAREYLGNSDPRIRAQVAALLGEIRAPESFDLLARLIRDGDPTVQVAAAAGIGSGD